MWGPPHLAIASMPAYLAQDPNSACSAAITQFDVRHCRGWVRGAGMHLQSSQPLLHPRTAPGEVGCTNCKGHGLHDDVSKGNMGKAGGWGLIQLSLKLDLVEESLQQHMCGVRSRTVYRTQHSTQAHMTGDTACAGCGQKGPCQGPSLTGCSLEGSAWLGPPEQAHLAAPHCDVCCHCLGTKRPVSCSLHTHQCICKACVLNARMHWVLGPLHALSSVPAGHK